MLSVAGVDRQHQQLLASARHAAGGLLAGLAAATVTLSAGPAGAEVRMPPIDRNGESLLCREGAHQGVTGATILPDAGSLLATSLCPGHMLNQPLLRL